MDDEETTRCWVTLRIAVDVDGAEPDDESVRDALGLALSAYFIDRDHISWGVEGVDAEHPGGERYDGLCLALARLRYTGVYDGVLGEEHIGPVRDAMKRGRHLWGES
jgi:hypothetical protein